LICQLPKTIFAVTLLFELGWCYCALKATERQKVLVLTAKFAGNQQPATEPAWAPTQAFPLLLPNGDPLLPGKFC
jgi:hypothetical protein